MGQAWNNLSDSLLRFENAGLSSIWWAGEKGNLMIAMTTQSFL